MKSEVIVINGIESAIDDLKRIFDDGHQKGTKFEITNIDRAPGSGTSVDLIAHHQGVYQCDGDGNYIITGSTKENPGYFYMIKNSTGSKSIVGKDYYSIETVMTHPGGIQVAENILAIGNEQYSGATTRDDRSNVRFFDIGADGSIIEMNHLLIQREGKGKIASAVAFTKNGNQWVLAIRANDSIDFYTLGGDISSKESKFNYLGDLDKKSNGFKDFQAIQIFPGKDKEGNIVFYLFGMPDGSKEEDKMWIYKINFTFENNVIKKVNHVSFYTTIHFHRDGDGPRFKYGAGISYVNNKFEVTSISGHVESRKIKCNKWR